MGVLKRGKDGVYRHVRGEVPWADNALDRIAEEDRMGTIRPSARDQKRAALDAGYTRIVWHSHGDGLAAYVPFAEVEARTDAYGAAVEALQVMAEAEQGYPWFQAKASETLRAMGVDPATDRGQCAAPREEERR